MIRAFFNHCTDGGIFFAVLLNGSLLLAPSVQGAEPKTRPSAEAVRFFESRIRPLLADNCFKCHADKKQRDGLRLDSRAAPLAGGDQGAAIMPARAIDKSDY